MVHPVKSMLGCSIVLLLVISIQATDPQNFPSGHEIKICTGKADVVVVLDRSASVGELYNYLANFTLYLAQTFDIDQDIVRLGVVSYATKASRDIEMNVGATGGFDAFEAKISNLAVHDGQLTNIEDALETAEEMLYDASNGARENTIKMMVITNDGLHTKGNPPLDKAKELHDKGINIVSIGITRDVNDDPIDVDFYKKFYVKKSDESRGLASAEDLYYYVDRYEHLQDETFLKRITETVCQRVTVNGPLVQDTSESVNEDVLKGYLVHTIPFTISTTVQSEPMFTLIDDTVPFLVEELTGKITTSGLLDFETTPKYVFRIRVTDKYIATFFKDITVTIYVVDLNDNAPTVTKVIYNVEILENIEKSVLFTIEASDKDKIDAGKLVFKITSSDDTTGDFSLDTKTGEFAVAKALDRETKHSYEFKVVVYDSNGVAGAMKSAEVSINVKVLDVNDSPPKFEKSSLTLNFKENQALGLLYTVLATDEDLGSNGKIVYSIQSGNADGRFKLDSDNGKLELLSYFDFEQQAYYKLQIEAKDSGLRPNKALFTLHMNIEDIDEIHTVNIGQTSKIPENFPTNQEITSIRVNDPENAVIEYSIKETSPFQIDSRGRLVLSGSINREGTQFVYDLTIVVKAGLHTVEKKTQIIVTDVNDERPKCTRQLYKGRISESAGIDEKVALDFLIGGIDNDATSPNNAVSFGIAFQSKDAFKISTDGVLSVNKEGALNYEEDTRVTVFLKVSDGGSPTNTASCVVEIDIVNANDNAPVFSGTPYKANVREDASKLTEVLQLTVTDEDKNQLSYTIEEGVPFGVDNGEIFVNDALDIETVSSYSFQVTVDDGANKVSTNVEVTLIDVNDHAPQFQVKGPFELSLREDVGPGSAFYTFAASDGDKTEPNNKFTFSIQSGSDDFTINENTGAFSVNKALKHSAKSEYNYILKVTDRGTDPKQLFTTLSLKVLVTSANFDSPTFEGAPYTVSVDENIVNPFIIKVTVIDNDVNEELKYELVESPNFRITDDGKIFATISFDAEGISQWVCRVRVTDKAGHKTETTVTVNVGDVNDNTPIFISGPNSFPRLAENTDVGVVLGTYKATDGDKTAPNNVVMYTITGGNGKPFFEINMGTGELKLIKELDYETNSELGLTITASDKGDPSRHTDKGIEIAIQDINEGPPKFITRTDTPGYYEESVSEDKLAGYKVLTVEAKDESENVKVSYSIPTGLPFEINELGEIRLVSLNPPELPLDFETTQKYEFDVSATDGTFTSIAKIVINVLDVNDHTPVFKELKVEEDIYENHPLQSLVASVKAEDKDGGINGMVIYEIIAGDNDNRFYITPEGDIKLLNYLDFETTQRYELTIKASDKGVPDALSTNPLTHATVIINVKDVNEKPIWTERYTVEVSENVKIKTVLTTVKAKDQDAGENGVLLYTLVGDGNKDDKFELNTDSGAITLKNNLNFEEQTEYTLTIRATDKGKPALSTEGADTTVIITVLDVNEKPYFEPVKYEKTLKELSKPGAEVVTVVAKDMDGGDNGKLMYEILPSSDPQGIFTIDMNTGEITTEKLLLDYKIAPTYTLRIRATDKGSPKLSTYPDDAVVIVTVEDENNNPPVFNPKDYTKTISESTAPNTEITRVFATDNDAGKNGEIVYEFLSGNEKGLFRLDAESGQIYLVGKLDFESMKQFTLKIRAYDNGDPKLNSDPDATVVIDITDANEHAPEITNLPDTVKVAEDEKSGFEVKLVSAMDKDIEDTITYTITTFNPSGPFKIDETSGRVTTTGDLDRETQDTYVLSITASDGKFTDTEQLTIKITDVNDNNPTFTVKNIENSVSENEDVGFVCATVEAEDDDLNENADIMYMIVGENEFFQIDQSTGIITLKAPLDYETTQKHTIIVRASDKGDPSLSTEGNDATVTITVLDYNDNSPIFEPVEKVTLPEDTDPKVISTVKANDVESGENGRVVYEIINGNEDNKFSIDKDTGKVSLVGSLDYELVTSYKLTIRALDNGKPQLTSEPNDAMLVIMVTDVNDNAPIFNPDTYTRTISEGSEPNDFVVTVEATDKDSGDNGKIMYTITGGEGKELFDIDMETGKVVVVGPLDRESRDKYVITVTATDKGDPSQSSTATVTILISDENDNQPKFTKEKYDVDVYEDEKTGKNIVKVEATDKDIGKNKQILYKIVAPPSHPFSINELNGQITLREPLDYEKVQQYILTVQAMDQGEQPKSSQVKVCINVLDVNDNHPVFVPETYTETVSESTKPGVGVILTTVSAKDADENGEQKVMYTIKEGDETLFAVDMNTGVVTLVGQLDFESKSTHTIIIKATDKGEPSLSSDPDATVTITVTNSNDNAPNFINEPYKESIMEKVGSGTDVITCEAVDDDNDVLEYTLTSENVPFKIDSATGKITTSGEIDREKEDEYLLTVEVTDGKNKDTTTVMVTILDKNDNEPQVENIKVEIKETFPVDNTVTTVVGTDADAGDNGKFMFEIEQGNEDGVFELDMNTGAITLVKPLDYETVQKYTLTIKTSDKGEPVLTTSSLVEIIVLNVNEHDPTCEDLTVEAFENVDLLTSVVATVVKNDQDKGLFGEVVLSITGGNTEGRFDIKDGRIFAVKELDYETTTQYVLKITAQDKGNPPRSSQCSVTVNVKDFNDNAPEFNPKTYTYNIKETTPVKERVGQVTAEDKDSGKNKVFMFKIESGNLDATKDGTPDFAINSNTGEITVASPLDASTPVYQLSISATDKGDNPLTSKPFAIVTITVSNVNQPPSFTNLPYDVTVSENIAEKSKIRQVTATDPDNDELKFMILTKNVPFVIDEKTGQITSSGNLDRETQAKYTLTVKVSDGLEEAQTTFTVTLRDENDNPPQFEETSYKETIPENFPLEQLIVTVNALDIDEGKNQEIMYMITDGNDENKFTINQVSGDITLIENLDFETTQFYTLEVTASDKGSSPQESTVKVEITVTDINDNYPIFNPEEFTKEFPEDVQLGTVCVTVIAEDKDDGDNGKVEYFFKSGNEDGVFVLDKDTGVIKFTKTVDFETKTKYTLVIGAKDLGSPSKTSKNDATVTVTITDVNDNKPTFLPNLYERFVPESRKPGYEVVTVLATDKDSGLNGMFMFKIESGNEDGVFEIDAIVTYHHGQPVIIRGVAIWDALQEKDTSQIVDIKNQGTGRITLKQQLNFEEKKYYKLIISATDKGNTPMTSDPNAIVEIHVTNVNDNPPKFEELPYNAMVTEHVKDGTFVIKTTASDLDGDKLTYSVIDTNVPFVIDPDTGRIITKGVIDREVMGDVIVFNIKVSDGKNSDVAKVSVTIKDINDNAPTCKDDGIPVGEDFEINEVLFTFKSTDADIGINGEIMFEIIEGNDDKVFELDQKSGELILLTQLDFETTKSYTLKIKTSDKGSDPKQQSCLSTLTITIEDRNDNDPQAENIVVDVDEDTAEKTVIATVEGTDEDSGDNGRLMYEIVSGNDDYSDKFEIDMETGKITIKELLDFEQVQQYILKVKVSDKGSTQRSTMVSVTVNVKNVNDNAPIFKPQTYERTILETTKVGKSVIEVSATDLDIGKFGKITYMIVNGNQDATKDGQPDFSIDPGTGVISVNSQLDASTPKYILTVKATDGGNQDSELHAQVTIYITNVNKAPYFTNTPFEKTIPEDFGENKQVIMITAADPDGDKLTFSIISDSKVPFRINKEDGKIFTTEELDRESQDKYTLVIQVSDGQLAMTTTCVIIITDVNDNKPDFGQKECFTIDLNENAKVNQVYLTVEATDKDIGKNGQIKYEIISGNEENNFEINSNNGQIKLVKELDFETTQSFKLTVRATDMGETPLFSDACVEITVIDLNDNPPVFKPVQYEVEFKENVTKGTTVTTVKATDADSGKNGEIMYKIIKGDQSKFKINANTGQITFKDTVDFEKQSYYELVIEATDKGGEPRSSEPDALVKITITDVNDNSPVFEFSDYVKNIPETFPKGGLVETIEATDGDAINNGVMYTIKSGNEANDFVLDMNTGKLRTNDKLDVTSISVYEFIVIATDKGTPSRSTEVSVTVNINDVNMQPDVKPCGSATILDNHEKNKPVLKVIASDPDLGDNGKIMYEISEGDEKFTIDMNSGQVFLKSSLSLAKPAQFKITVKVSDKGTPSLSDTEQCTIVVNPSNNPPIVDSQGPISVREDEDPGAMITNVVARDNDEGKNGELMFVITSGNGESGSVFEINMKTGEITLNEKLDFHKQKKYQLTVTVSDKGTPSLSASTIIRINVESVTKPKFDDDVTYETCIFENEAAGTKVFTAEATDADGDSLKYSLSPDNIPFQINENTGVITTTRSLDREEKSGYEFNIEARDSIFTVSVTLKVCIKDVNDNKPVISPITDGVICEGVQQGEQVKNIVVKVTDQDLNNEITYKLISDDVDFPFAIDDDGKITLSGSIDFETKEVYEFNVQVNDGKHTVTEKAKIKICNVNEHDPIFKPVKYDVTIYEDSKPDSFVVKVTATDKDSGNAGMIVYSIISGNGDKKFQIDPVTGKITVQNKFTFAEEQKKFTLVVRATDKGVPPRSSDPNAQVVITVKKRAPLCRCELESNALKFNSLTWTTRMIIRKFPAKSTVQSLKLAISFYEKQIASLSERKQNFQQCQLKIRTQLLGISRDYSLDELLTNSCECRDNIQAIMSTIAKLQHKIDCWEKSIQYYSRNMCPRYCKCVCWIRNMDWTYYKNQVSETRCKKTGFDYSTCNCGC